MRTGLVGGAIVAALAVAVAAAYGVGSPIAGGTEGTDLWSIVFIASVGTGFVLYVAGLLMLRPHANAVRSVLVLGAVIQLVPLTGPLLLSRDAYSYWAYGRIVWVHHANPYAVPPKRYPDDPATRAAAPAWRGTTSVYGPLFTAGSAGVAAVSGSSRWTAAFLFRSSAALAVVATALVAARLARRRAFAAALVGWNPLFAVHFAGGGHNDALMVLLLVGSLALVRRRESIAGALWVASGAIKSVALLLLPFELVRARWRLWLGSAGALASLALVSSFAFGDDWLAGLGGLSRREAGYSIPSRLDQLGLGEVGSTWIPRLVLIATASWLLREARRGRTRLGLAAGMLLVTTQWILPWYAIWPIALAAAEEDGLAQVIGVAVAAYLVADRVPF